MQVSFAADAPECPDSRLISFHSTGHSEEAGQGRGRREQGQERRVGEVKKGRGWTKEEGGESGAEERRVGEGETVQCPGLGWNGERPKWPTLSLEVEVFRLC